MNEEDDANDPPQLPSAAEQPSQKYEISNDEIGRFFAEKWKNEKCEICGETGTWSTNPGDEKYSVFPISNGVSITTLSQKVIVSLMVACNNCGNMKFLISAVIDQWLKNNPAPNG